MKKKKFEQGACPDIWSCISRVYDHKGDIVLEYYALLDRSYFKELKEQFDEVYKLNFGKAKEKLDEIYEK